MSGRKPHHHHHHLSRASSTKSEDDRLRKGPIVAKQVCCLVDSFAPDEARYRALLHLKYVNESVKNLELEGDVKVLSVTLADGTISVGKIGGLIVPTTRLCFVYRRYHVAVLLDMSESMYCICKMQTLHSNHSEYVMPRHQVIPVLRTLLKALELPLGLPVSGISVRPTVKVTVIVRLSNLSCRLVEGVILEKERTERILQTVKTGLERLEDLRVTRQMGGSTLAERVVQAAKPVFSPHETVKGGRVVLMNHKVTTIDGGEAVVTETCSSEHLLNYLSETIAALQYVDPVACPSAVMITDGVLPQPNAPCGDERNPSLVTLLRLDIPLHFIHLSSEEMTSGSFSAIPDISNLLFCSSMSGGTCFDMGFMRHVQSEAANYASLSKQQKRTSKRHRRRGKTKTSGDDVERASFLSISSNGSSSTKGLVEEYTPQIGVVNSARLLIALLCRFSQLEDASSTSSGATSSNGGPPSKPTPAGPSLQAGAVDTTGPSLLRRRSSFGSTSQLREEQQRPPLHSTFLPYSTLSESGSLGASSFSRTDLESSSPLVPFYSPLLHKPALEPRVRKLHIIQPLVAIDNSFPWHGRPPAVPVCVHEVVSYRLHLNPSEILMCRLRDGFFLKQILYDQQIYCVRLALSFAPHVTINYILKAARSRSENKVDNQRKLAAIAVSVRVIASPDFLRSFYASAKNPTVATTANNNNPSPSSPTASGFSSTALVPQSRDSSAVLKLHQLINSILEGDRVLVHLSELYQHSCQVSPPLALHQPDLPSHQNRYTRRHASKFNAVRKDKVPVPNARRDQIQLLPSNVQGEAMAQALFSAFTFESLSRWHRWFFVESYDLLFQSEAVRENLLSKVLDSWADFVSEPVEGNVYHFFRMLDADHEVSDGNRSVERKDSEHFVEYYPASFVLGRICFLSGFLTSLHLAFPSTADESSRFATICRLLVKIEEVFPGRVKRFKQSKKPISEMCSVSVPIPSSVADKNRALFLRPTQSLVHSFTQRRVWAWKVPDAPSAHFIIRSIVRARYRESFTLTASSLPVRKTTGDYLDVDDSKAGLDPNGCISFCKLLPTFDTRHMRQSKDMCLIQYRVSFPEPGIVRTEFWMESSVVYFKPYGGHLLGAVDLFRLLEQHFATLDSDLISTAIAFLQVQSCATNNLLSTWTASAPSQAPGGAAVRTWRLGSSDTSASEMTSTDDEAAQGDMRTPRIKVQNGVASFLKFGRKSKLSLEVFKSRGASISTPNSKYLESFRESMENITDARVYGAAATDKNAEEDPVKLCETDDGMEDSEEGGAFIYPWWYFAKVIDVNRILVLSFSRNLRTNFPQEHQRDSNPNVENFLDLELHEIDCREFFFPANLVDPALAQLLGYRENKPTAVHGGAKPRESSKGQAKATEDDKVSSSKPYTAFVKQIKSAHLYDMVYTIHWIFASESNKEKLASMLHPKDIDFLLHQCPYITALVDASLLRTILSVTLNPRNAPSPTPSPLHEADENSSSSGKDNGKPSSSSSTSTSTTSPLMEIDRRFASILNEFFQPIKDTSFYCLDPKHAGSLFEGEQEHENDDEDDEDEDGQEEEVDDEEDLDEGTSQGAGGSDNDVGKRNERKRKDASSLNTPTVDKTKPSRRSPMSIRTLRSPKAHNQGTSPLPSPPGLSPSTTNAASSSPVGSGEGTSLGQKARSAATFMAHNTPPVFFRICCTSQRIVENVYDESNPSNQEEEATIDTSPDITNGRVCESIMTTSQGDPSTKVFINLIFCTLPKRPTRRKDPSSSPWISRSADSPSSIFQGRMLWIWTRAVRRRIRTRVKAMVSSAVLTALQRVYPVTGKTISLVQQLLDRGSLPSSSVTRMTIPLFFANQEMGVRLFAAHIEKTPVLNLRRVGNSSVYFIVEPLNKLSSRKDSEGDGGGVSNSSSQQHIATSPPLSLLTFGPSLDMQAFREVHSNDLDFPLSIAAPTLTLREEWNSREYTVPYWAIITVTGPAVNLEFHHPSLSNPNEARVIIDFLKNGIRKTVERVNQMILLNQLHETRVASRLLIEPGEAEDQLGLPPRSGPSSQRSNTGPTSRFVRGQMHAAGRGREPRIARPEQNVNVADKAGGASGAGGSSNGTMDDSFEANNGWDPSKMPSGRLACPCYYRESFPVPERLHISVAMHELRENALHLFEVSNRRNTFVYRDRSGPIFYLKLKEVLGEDGTQNKVLLEVYGVDPPSDEMKGILSSLLSSKISNATLNSLGLLLHRNPQFKIQAYDLSFIQSSSPSKPLETHVLRIPSEVSDLLAFLLFFKQNLLQFMNQLHFGFSPESMLSASSSLLQLGAAVSTRDETVNVDEASPSSSSSRAVTSPEPLPKSTSEALKTHPSLSMRHSVRWLKDASNPLVVQRQVFPRDATKVSPVFFGAYHDPAFGEQTVAVQTKPALKTVEIRRDDFAFFYNSVSTSKTSKQNQTFPLDVGSGIAVCFASLCRKSCAPKTKGEERENESEVSSTQATESKLDNFEVIGMLETVDDVALLDQELVHMTLGRGGSARFGTSLISRSTSPPSPTPPLSTSSPSEDDPLVLHQRRRSWAPTSMQSQDTDAGNTPPVQLHRLFARNESPCPEESVPENTANFEYSIVLEFWQTGNISLDKLWNRLQLAFTHALQEYRFEKEKAEQLLRLNAPGFTLAASDLPSLDSIEDKPENVENVEQLLSPSFEQVSFTLDSGVHFDARAALLLEMSKLLMQLQPDLCQFSAKEISAGHRSSNKTSSSNSSSPRSSSSSPLLEPFELFETDGPPNTEKNNHTFVAKRTDLLLVASTFFKLCFAETGTSTLQEDLLPDPSPKPVEFDNVKLKHSFKYARVRSLASTSSTASRAFKVCGNEACLVRPDSLLSPHCVVPALGPSPVGGGTGTPATSLIHRGESASSTVSTGSSVESGTAIVPPTLYKASSQLSPPPVQQQVHVHAEVMSVSSAVAGSGNRGHAHTQTCTKKRNCYTKIRVSETEVSLLLYNWSPAKSKAFLRAVHFLVSWALLRGGLLRNIFYQRLGLFSHEGLSLNSVRFLTDVLSRLKTKSKDNSVLMQDLSYIFEHQMPPPQLLREVVDPDENSPKQPKDVPKPLPATRDKFFIARAAMESRKRGNLRAPSAFSPLMRQQVGSGNPGHSTSSAAGSSAASVTGSITSSQTGVSTVSASTVTPTTLGSVSQGGGGFRGTIRGRSSSLVPQNLSQGSFFPLSSSSSSSGPGLARVMFESQLRGQAQKTLLRLSSFRTEKESVRRFGAHALQETQYWSAKKNSKKLIRSVVIRWRQEWLGHSLHASQYPFTSIGGFQNHSSDNEEEDELCWCTPAEFEAVLANCRVLHGVRTPTFFDEHDHGLRPTAPVEDDGGQNFTQRVQADLVRVFMNFSIRTLGMRQIVVSETEPLSLAKANASSSGQQKEVSPSSSSSSNGGVHGPLEAYSQRVLNGAVVLLEAAVSSGVFKCSLRLLEPDRNEEALFSGSAQEASTAEDFFLINTSRQVGPTYAQELSRLRSSLNVSTVAYDFHIYMFQRTLRQFRKRPVGIACQVFHFSKQFPTPPVGASNALMRQTFQFLCGVKFADEDLRQVFQYVVDKAHRYGMVGLRPLKAGGKHYLFLSCNDGTFSNPFVKCKTGFRYSVIVGEIDANDHKGLAVDEDVAGENQQLDRLSELALSRSTSSESTASGQKKRKKSISLDVCLMAADDRTFKKLLQPVGKETDGVGVKGAVGQDDEEFDDEDEEGFDDDEFAEHAGEKSPVSTEGEDVDVGLDGKFASMKRVGKDVLMSFSPDSRGFDMDDQEDDSIPWLGRGNERSTAVEAGGHARRTSGDAPSGDDEKTVVTREEGGGQAKGNKLVETVGKICSMEEAFDNVDLFLHKVFSHAVLRYQRKVFWNQLQQLSVQGGVMETGTPGVSIKELTHLSLRCNLGEVDPSFDEFLATTTCWKGMLSFLRRTYKSMALRGEEHPDKDLVILPDPSVTFGFVIHVHFDESTSEPPSFQICFPSAVVSNGGLVDGQLYLTSFVQSLYTWLWTRLDVL